ncbi:uncharacterized protein LOC127712207 isoform X1 [Mytilus californianus]|uniref:uncharacterized protein LOC127712207 isoform X1 n=1 Tax=Mytilus californianus TaxID=6549 RepID=UPI0022469052|nr:uncharacterized protein LOC127712207 isoform X1 [Mytilus californianus]XP_052074465.1 uncharacterized protein LOC127712207 isoform X1 [Mytilus californianus]XP_052074466.1 uncharacterized protein LOC127712207 isoform X1 [Mytilus californianus]XP_052074467.1 uncharacterized protein LOC127712207 isoform X1 [Mytilus californianus]
MSNGTKENDHENNHLRIANLVFKIAPPAVRVYFDKQFNPGGLQAVLNQNRFKTLNSLKSKRIINQTQWDLLFPSVGAASSLTFDLTLMICLLRNLANIKVEDKLPADSDDNIEADLTRIKYYRNKIAHSDHKTMTEEEFNIQWEAISKAIIRLGGESFKAICHDLQNYKLDKEILVEIKNLNVTRNPVPKGLQDVHDEKIKEWRDEVKDIVETTAIKALEDMTATKNVIFVIGPSGCGKTTSVHYVALTLHDQQDYDIIPAYFPTDITQYYNPYSHQIFVFDDLCGKYSIDVQSLDTWNRLSGDIHKILVQNKIKLFMTCRSHIFNDKKFQRFTVSAESIDLINAKYALSDEERYLIAEKYLSSEQIQTLKRHKNLIQFDCFPLLCRIFLSKSTCDIVKFFSSPVEIIKDDLLSLMKENDQTAIATLSLFVLYNNCITEEDLSHRNKAMKDILNHLSDIYITSQHLSFAVVRNQIESLRNSYVKKTRHKYRVIHDKLFDILSSFCGEHMEDLLLDFCPPEFIRDRFQFESIEEEMDECIIKVDKNREDQYFDRLYKDIVSGFGCNVFTNRQLQFESFRCKFVENIQRRINLKETSILFSGESPFLDVVKKGHYDIAEMLLKFNIDVNVRDKMGRTPLYLAVEEGHTNMVKLLVAHDCDPHIYRKDYWHKGETAIYIASSKGYLDIVKMLFKTKQDCYRCRQDDFFAGRTPLHEAANNNHLEIVNFFMNQTCDPNIINENNESPLWLASREGHFDMVNTLLNYKANPNLHTKKNGTPLSIASWYGWKNIVQILLQNKADANIVNSKKCSPLFYAAREGQAEIVKHLLTNGANVNALTQYLKSPLFIAAHQGKFTVVEFLIANKGDVNICNDDNESPLFAAAKRGKVEIVKLLLRNGAKPNIRTTYNSTALCIAREKRHNEIVEILSSYLSCSQREQLAHNIEGQTSSTGTALTRHTYSSRRTTNINIPRQSCCSIT